MKNTPLAGALDADVGGLDLSRPLDAETVDELVLMGGTRATIHMALTDYAAAEPPELLRTSLVGELMGEPAGPP